MRENKTLVGNGMMAYKHSQSVTRQPTKGTMYESLSNHVYMDLPLSEVAGYDTKRVLFSPLWNLWAL
ncbi:MAG: hypothetical protein ACLUDG_03270 [Butyricicoccus sp.]